MLDRAHTPFVLTSMRIGRTDLGEGAALLDDDALLLTVRDAEDDRPVRVALQTVDAIALDAAAVTLALHDGTRLTLSTADASHLRDDLLARCRAIPELTRALRAFGSRRGHRSARDTGPSEQQRFFAPLLDARRVAMAAPSPWDAMAAFDAAALDLAIARALSAFATERHGDNAPARRALEAELVDLSEPLRDALESLRLVAADAAAAVDDLQLWRSWSAQLRATFETADRVWLSLDSALDSVPWRG